MTCGGDVDENRVIGIVIATPSDLERHWENIGLIYRAVLREGREIYAAA